jgi:glutathione-regulated potassium-efflux system ancillary protein KefG
MNRILILFANPLFEKSRIHQALVKAVPQSEHMVFHDLYELYPDFNIRIEHEKKLLVDHDIIIWQHPFYWYGIPPLLKQWIDLVLEFGWAYGPGGVALKDKIIFNAISAGGRQEAYAPEGRNRYEIRQFLAPLEQTVKLCLMTYAPPFVVHGTHSLTEKEIGEHAEHYNRLLQYLERTPMETIKNFNGKYLNEIVP